MHRQRVALLRGAAAVIAATAWATVASAAGIEYPDNGTIAIGRGGANAANPSDGLAFQYNPAGLAQQRGWNILLDVRESWQQLRFASTSLAGPAVENNAPPFLGPSAAISYGLGKVGPFSELTFALGATGPSSIGKSRFPSDGVQRYAIDSTNYFIAFYSAAVSAGIGDWLRFGVTGQLAHGDASFTQAVYSGLESGHDPKADSEATFSGVSGWIPTGVFGLTLLPRKDIAVGLSWRPAIRFAAPGHLDTKVAAAFAAGSGQVGNDAELHLAFADVVRAGIAWDVDPRLQVEVDAVYERWSVMKEIRISTPNIRVYTPFSPFVDGKPQTQQLPDIVFPHNFQDTWSGRFGAEYKALPDRLTVRGGYLFETSAVPSQYVSVDFGNWGRHVGSVGTSVRVFTGAWLDLAYAHHFVATQVITDSKIEQKQTPYPPIPGGTPPKPEIVGNGTYTASMDIVSISLRLALGSL